MGWRRAFVLGGAAVVTLVAAYQMYLVLGVGGLTLLEGVILALFVVLFAWIALALVSALCGFASLVAGGGRRLDPEGSPLPTLAARTALLMPCYNEQPGPRDGGAAGDPRRVVARRGRADPGVRHLHPQRHHRS